MKNSSPKKSRMRKHHNKLFYGLYRHKTVFHIPWAPILHPTTDQNLQGFLDGTHRSIRYLHKKFYQSNSNISKLAKFIIHNRKKMKFRLQQDSAIFYSDKKLASELVVNFWDYWMGTQIVDPKYKMLDANTVGCTKLPHGKYKVQIHMKKDIHNIFSENERKNIADFVERNIDECYVSNRGLIEYLEGQIKFCYEGYFYVTDEKMLTAIYMIAQKGIDKVIKYKKVKNESNKKVKRG